MSCLYLHNLKNHCILVHVLTKFIHETKNKDIYWNKWHKLVKVVLFYPENSSKLISSGYISPKDSTSSGTDISAASNF